MAHQAIVTLSSRTPGIMPATRILKLNPDHRTIPIGRASRSVSKGLLGAEDNAWFDNPVMSRDHAELIFNPDDMSVMIKDIRSMHGTQLNDVKLPLDTPRNLKDGDIVSFGAEVRRGQDTFPPCRFHVAYQFVPWTRGFQFPGSDIEESEEDEDKCEDSQENETTPIESPVPKKYISIDAIDLTRDDSEPKATCNASKASTAKEPSPETQSTSLLVEETIIRSSGHLENPILLEDPESEDSDSSELNVIQEDYEDSEESSAEDSDKENDDNEEEQGIVEESVYNWNESVQTPEVLDTHEEAPPHMFYDNKDIPVSSMRTTVGLLDAQAEVDTGSDSLVDEEWEASFQDNTGEHTHEETVLSQAHDKTMIENSFDESAEFAGPKAPLQAFVASAPSSSLWEKFSGNRLPSPSDAAMPKSTKIPSMAFSDETNTRTINPVQIHHQSEQNWKAGPFIPLTLGEKLGKQDFFQAWEINRARMADEVGHNNEHSSISDGIARAKFNQLGHPYNPRPIAPLPNQSGMSRYQQQISQHQQLVQQRMAQENQISQQAVQQQTRMANRVAEQQRQQMVHQMQQIEARQHMEACRARAAYSNSQLLAQQQAFSTQFTSPQQCSFGSCTAVRKDSNETGVKVSNSARPDSPELDMTSAVRFNESKASAFAQKKAVQDNRSVVRIDDIVEPSDTISNANGLKRKADEISDVEEVRVWASRDASIPAAKIENTSSAAMVPSDHTHTQEHLDTTNVVSSPATVETAPQPHPSKKLKRFAEAVGYAALGGLAVGAGLFSVLVATAPDFN